MLRISVLLVIFAFNADAGAQELTPKQFRSAGWALLDDPTGKDADDYAQGILSFASETKAAEVVMDKPEMSWIGDNKNYQKVLTAAYIFGNVQSQLNTGVVRNDRYAGVLTLIAAYRKIQEKDKAFKVAAIDELRKLHKDDKLAAHLAGIGKKKMEN